MAGYVRQSNMAQGFPTLTLAFPAATMAGSTLVALIGVQDAAANITAIGVSDPVNGNWTQLGTAATTATVTTYVFRMENASSLASTQNVTHTRTDINGPGSDLHIIELPMVTRSSGHDPATYASTTGDSTSGGSSTLVTSLTTLVASDVYLYLIGTPTAQTWGTPAGWTLVKQSGSVAGSGMCSASYTETVAAGTISVTSTAAAASVLAGRMAAFQPLSTALVVRLQNAETLYTGAGGTTAQTFVYTQPTAANNTLVLAVADTSSNAGTISGVGDAVNGNWTKAVQASTTVLPVAGIWYFPNAAALTTAQAVTIHTASSVIKYAGQLLEYQQTAVASLDKSTQQSLASSQVAMALTPAFSSEAFVAIAAEKTIAVTWTATSAGWNRVASTGSTSNIAYAVWDRYAGDSSGVSVSATLGWAGLATSLRGAMISLIPIQPVAGGPPIRFLLMGAGR